MPHAAAAGQRRAGRAAKSKHTIGSKLTVWALRNEPFQGARVDLVNVLNICCRKASDLYVSSAKSARARNLRTGVI